MNRQKLPSLLGGSMIIAGTAIGAGMLANPTAMSVSPPIPIYLGNNYPIGFDAFGGQPTLRERSQF